MRSSTIVLIVVGGVAVSVGVMLLSKRGVAAPVNPTPIRTDPAAGLVNSITGLVNATANIIPVFRGGAGKPTIPSDLMNPAAAGSVSHTSGTYSDGGGWSADRVYA